MSDTRSRSRSPNGVRRASRSRSPSKPVDPTLNKLFIGNLSYETSERELEDIFVKFGKVTEARLAVDKFNGRPKGFAFVTMEDARDAADACKELVDHELNGRVMRVEVSHGMGGARRRDDRSGYRGGGYRDRGRDRSRDRSRDRRDRSRDRDYGRGRDRSRDRDYRRDRRRSRSRSHSRGRR